MIRQATGPLEAQKQECAVDQCRSKDLAFQVSLTEAKLGGDVLTAGFWDFGLVEEPLGFYVS